MTAVFKHELKSYFHSLTAYIFGAFLLAFVGIGAMMYNIQASVSNFELYGFPHPISSMMSTTHTHRVQILTLQ